jgi:hypothetical protein
MNTRLLAQGAASRRHAAHVISGSIKSRMPSLQVTARFGGAGGLAGEGADEAAATLAYTPVQPLYRTPSTRSNYTVQISLMLTLATWPGVYDVQAVLAAGLRSQYRTTRRTCLRSASGLT